MQPDPKRVTGLQMQAETQKATGVQMQTGPYGEQDLSLATPNPPAPDEAPAVATERDPLAGLKRALAGDLGDPHMRWAKSHE